MRLKILILLPRIPFPLRDGGAIAMNQTLEELTHQDCEVSVLSMNTARHYVEVNELPAVYTQLKAFQSVFIDNTISPLSAFLNLFTGESYNIARFIDKSFRLALLEMLKAESFDIVIFESIYTSPYLKDVQENSQAKCFCRVHNIEYLIWQRLCEHETSFFKKKYLSLLTDRLKTYELNILKEFDLLLPISKHEENFFLKQKINSSYYLPFGTSIHDYPEVVEERNTLYHIGSMDWAPNLEGIEWFLDEVWTDLQKKLPGVKLYLAGKKMPKPIFHKQNEQTIVLGEVDDVITFSLMKEIMLVPLLSGAGIRVKVLEAMALGKAIIATSMAVEGIDVIDGVHIIIANQAEEFEQKITYYLDHPQERIELGLRAKEFVRLNYQKKKIYHDLVIGFKNLM